MGTPQDTLIRPCQSCPEPWGQCGDRGHEPVVTPGLTAGRVNVAPLSLVTRWVPAPVSPLRWHCPQRGRPSPQGQQRPRPPAVTMRCPPPAAGDHSPCPVSPRPPVPQRTINHIPPTHGLSLPHPRGPWGITATPWGQSRCPQAGWGGAFAMSPQAVTGRRGVTQRVYCAGRPRVTVIHVSPRPHPCHRVPTCHSAASWCCRSRFWRCRRRRSRSNSFMRIT